ncbi:MAG: hypothetical protein B7Z37_14235 [Verrucomicrobia bacterium 12-59-8]|nr:MAG: hypothetical protein B7Z37_14235 [Verrucomicrobia bacterium 12-59-8]
MAESDSYTDQINLKAIVDFSSVKIQANKLWFVNGPYTVPTKISVMGRKWEPKWPDNVTSEAFTNFKKPLKPFENATIKLSTMSGRGLVQIKEQPTAANQWTLTIEIVDPPAGVDEYSLRISW